MLYKCLSSIKETETEKNLKIEVLVFDNDKSTRANINYILRKCYYNGYAGTLQGLKRFQNNKAVI